MNSIPVKYSSKKFYYLILFTTLLFMAVVAYGYSPGTAKNMRMHFADLIIEGLNDTRFQGDHRQVFDYSKQDTGK